MKDLQMTAVEWLIEQVKSKEFNDMFIWHKEEIFNQAEKLEKQQSDDYAIEFAEWVSYKYKYLENKGWFATTYQLEMGIFLSSKQLLETFKKEKGL